MLLIVAGAVFLLVTFAHNNSLECTTSLLPNGGCAKDSYLAPIALLAGGFGVFFLGMVASAADALRHVGAPVLGALNAKRRVWAPQAGPEPGPATKDRRGRARPATPS